MWQYLHQLCSLWLQQEGGGDRRRKGLVTRCRGRNGEFLFKKSTFLWNITFRTICMKASAVGSPTKPQQSLHSILTLKTFASRIQDNGELFVYFAFTVFWISSLKGVWGDTGNRRAVGSIVAQFNKGEGCKGPNKPSIQSSTICVIA